MGQSLHTGGQTRKVGETRTQQCIKGEHWGKAREVACLGHGELVGQVEGHWLHPYSNRKRIKDVR